MANLGSQVKDRIGKIGLANQLLSFVDHEATWSGMA